MAHIGELKFTTAGEVMKPEVAILMGSKSDWDLMKKGADVLTEFGVPYHMEILSAHRTPKRAVEFAENALAEGYSVVIAGAGAAAHLAGVIAASTVLPVIGVPINATPLNGMDSLMSIVQMPSGIPVASVGVDASVNAALLALQIIGTSDTAIQTKLLEYKESMVKKIEIANSQVDNGTRPN